MRDVIVQASYKTTVDKFSTPFIPSIETIKISYAFIDYSFIILHLIFVYLDNNTFCLFTPYNKIVYWLTFTIPGFSSYQWQRQLVLIP